MLIEIDADEFAVNMRTNLPATVEEGLFGGIAINQLRNTWTQFQETNEHLDLTHLRWPGGTLAETGYFDANSAQPVIRLIDGAPQEGWVKAYSISYPDLLHPKLISSGAYPGFRTILEYAIENDMSLAITIPVAEMYSLTSFQKEASISTFLEKLFLFNDEKLDQLKEPIIFNVGNEQYDTPEAYAEAVAAVLTAVDEFRASHEIDQFQIAVQSMKNLESAQAFIAKIETLNCGGAISNIDIVRHHFLGIGLFNSSKIESTPERVQVVNVLVDLIEGSGVRDKPVSLYASAFSVDSLDVANSFDETGSHIQSGVPLSLASASSLVSLITGFVELGYSHAAIWGIGAIKTQSTVASYRQGDMQFSPVAEAYRMMAENTVGMTLLDEKSLDDNRRTSDVFHYSFVDSSKMIIFVAADDLPDNSINLEITLEDFGTVGNAWLERVVVDSGTAGPATTRKENVSIDGSAVSFSLENDFDFVMITIVRAVPGNDYLHAWGNDSSERLKSGSGGSLIEARGGNDALWGGIGADILNGGSGSDLLFGGVGLDTLIGGAGSDIFVFSEKSGIDTIMDFEVGVDRIDLSAWFNFYKSDMAQIEQTEYGALIRMGAEQIILRSLNGQSILANQFSTTDLTSLLGRDLENTILGTTVLATQNVPNSNGGIGDDTIIGENGESVISGGSGFDFVDYKSSTSAIFVDLLYSNLNKGSALGDKFISIEGIGGGGGSDNIRGDFGNNRLNGEGNVDWIYGRRGNDILDGGSGNDVLLGGVGADTLLGGQGKDRAQYSESQSGLTVDLQFTLRNTGEAKGDVFFGIEDLAGSSFDDFLFGDTSSNSIFGRDGRDLLDGRAGDDYLNGGAGSDTLIGGPGNDTLRGGTNSDTFVFSSGHDVIEDFRLLDFDKLGISRQLLPIDRAGNLNVLDAAQIVNGSVVMNFGSDTVITLQGVGTLVGLADMIYFF